MHSSLSCLYQQPFQGLAGRISGNSGYEGYFLWLFVACEMSPAKLNHLFFINQLSFLHDHESLNRFPPLLIRDTDHGHIGDSWVFDKSLFNLSWVNVLSSADDHLFLTIDYIEETIPIRLTQNDALGV